MSKCLENSWCGTAIQPNSGLTLSRTLVIVSELGGRGD